MVESLPLLMSSNVCEDRQPVIGQRGGFYTSESRTPANEVRRGKQQVLVGASSTLSICSKPRVGRVCTHL